MIAEVENPFVQLRGTSVPLPLPASNAFPEAAHLWSESEIDALILATAARRPLLVRGEAGCGKSQIARAAAAHLGTVLIAEVIHPRYEALDLLYRFDPVERLGDSQVRKLDPTNERYVKPGPLHRAMDVVKEGRPLPVLLIDEIDKADADVPNALLDVLGNRSFTIPYLDPPQGRRISTADGRMPIVVITTNEERELPAAFVRRCAVLNLNPPKDERFVDWLVERGEVHTHLVIDSEVRREAAEQVLRDRGACRAAGYPLVGLAEYIDLLTALHELTSKLDDAERRPAQSEWLNRLWPYALRKHARQTQDPPAPTELAAADSSKVKRAR